VLLCLTVLVGGYLAVCWFILSTLITPERRQAKLTPAELGFDDTQRLSFANANDRTVLQGWLVPSDGERAVVLVHGIHSNAWDCQAPDVVRAYVDAGFTVLLFDMRAHGESAGARAGLGVSESGDVKAAVRLLIQRGFSDGNIGIHGTSYGAATALLATEQIPAIGAIVADSSFADIRDVIAGELQRETGLPAGLANLLMPGMDWLARNFYGLRLDRSVPENAIRGIPPRPILLIHGRSDAVIPFNHVLRLKAAAGAAAEIWAIPGGHTQGVRMAPSCRQLAPTRGAFLARVVEFFDTNLR